MVAVGAHVLEGDADGVALVWGQVYSAFGPAGGIVRLRVEQGVVSRDVGSRLVDGNPHGVRLARAVISRILGQVGQRVVEVARRQCHSPTIEPAHLSRGARLVPNILGSI